MISLPRPDLKRCTTCRRAQPLTEFRLRNKGGTERLPQCRRCHYMAERERKQRKRELAERADFRKHLTKINQAEPDELNDLCAGILTRFGGVEGVMARLVTAHDAARPGSPAQVRCALTMLKVVQASADAEQKRIKRFEEDVRRGTGGGNERAFAGDGRK